MIRVICLKFICVCFLLSNGIAFAGSIEGPYIVWVNIDPDSFGGVDKKIKKYVNSGDDLCWNKDARLYMKKRPPGITEKAVIDALINNKKTTKIKLLNILSTSFDEVPSFDGLVVFSPVGGPRLISLSSTGVIKKDRINDVENIDSIAASFCLVMPPVVRKP